MGLTTSRTRKAKQLNRKAVEAEKLYTDTLELLDRNVRTGWFDSAQNNLDDLRTYRREWDKAGHLARGIQSDDWCLAGVSMRVPEDQRQYMVIDGRGQLTREVADAVTSPTWEGINHFKEDLEKSGMLDRMQVGISSYADAIETLA